MKNDELMDKIKDLVQEIADLKEENSNLYCKIDEIIDIGKDALRGY